MINNLGQVACFYMNSGPVRAASVKYIRPGDLCSASLRYVLTDTAGVLENLVLGTVHGLYD